MEHHTSIHTYRSQGVVPSWDTSRAQLSALSLYSAWTTIFCFPHQHYKDNDNRALSVSLISPSDNILWRFTASDIGSCLGTESYPSQASTYRHIQWNQKYRSQLIQSCTSLHVIYDLVAAQCAEIIAWLGWLCSSEIFNMRMNDVEFVPPHNGGVYGFPPKVGDILLQLLPSTKSSRNK